MFCPDSLGDMSREASGWLHSSASFRAHCVVGRGALLVPWASRLPVRWGRVEGHQGVLGY